VNGFNLGRYWSAGPQETLYLPGPLLRQGWNELTVLELHHTEKAAVVLQDRPELGSLPALGEEDKA
jgi:beta-galactosidase